MYTNERTSHAFNNKKTHLEKNTKKKKKRKNLFAGNATQHNAEGRVNDLIIIINFRFAKKKN